MRKPTDPPLTAKDILQDALERCDSYIGVNTDDLAQYRRRVTELEGTIERLQAERANVVKGIADLEAFDPSE